MKMNRFNPIPVISFLRSLRAHNDREWFALHKERYLKVKGDIETFTESLIEGAGTWLQGAEMLKPSDCLYRIYRDTRFSSDKTPFKTHIGIYINPPGGKKADTCGYYLHLEPDNCFVGGGAWWPQGERLKAVRQDIYDNVDEYLEILNAPGFRRFYDHVGTDFLKTAPKGFPKDWEYIDLLKPRVFTAMAPLTDEDLHAADFRQRVLDRMQALQPLNQFFNFTLAPEM